ncbi:PIG-L family deacetylase [Mycolicibacterium septicum DSM 44393]|uniref:PIG-L family deacetylase n=1 Tax=Mycolicibacterium septicum DSM 44393 TaxID=1341646 RepID=A0A7X6MQU6_9MYCO|nr:PIG-L family deacetylase [Mycolicibacterium septicum]NKZ13232.1 PIG-L family deacetylase [Mycolicibacterium septicum DSM 44393]
MTAAEHAELCGNEARFGARPLTCGGTPGHAWTTWSRSFGELDLAACPALVVVAPHPDDETLGFGATMALLAERGIDVRVVSVSDGGAAQEVHTPLERIRLERIRNAELRKAARILGVGEPISLGLPDGELAGHQDALADLLTGILEACPPGTWCVTTWRGDGHPDHEAVGRAAATAVHRTAAILLEYPVWMWHWATPGDPAVPWDRALMVPLTASAVGRKQAAAQCFRSQFLPPALGTGPVLPPFVLPRLLAVGEMVFR